MIGVDTNVLVRLFIKDDPRQHRIATKFFGSRTRDDPAFISVVTVIEFFWVLRRTYKRADSEVLSILQRLIISEDAAIESATRLRNAIDIAMSTGADLSDLMIADAGIMAGCTSTVTFDQPASDAVPGMELLK